MAEGSARQDTKRKEDWILKNNPWKKVNDVFKDRKVVLRYKIAMTSSLLSLIFGLAGFFAVAGSFNLVPVLHIFPILFPCCTKGFNVFLWSMIAVISIIGATISFFLGVAAGAAGESAAVNGLTIVFELITLYCMYSIDPRIKEKIISCFQECGCCAAREEIYRQKTGPNLDLASPSLEEGFKRQDDASSPPPSKPKSPTYKTPFESDATSVTKPDPPPVESPFASAAAKTLKSALNSFNKMVDDAKLENHAAAAAKAAQAVGDVSIEFEGENQGGKKVFVKREGDEGTLREKPKVNIKFSLDPGTLRKQFKHKSEKF